jgi:hypothetical protein
MDQYYLTQWHIIPCHQQIHMDLPHGIQQLLIAGIIMALMCVISHYIIKLDIRHIKNINQRSKVQ